MLVHLGAGVSVHSEDIISLTDLQQPLSPDTASLLDSLKRRRKVRLLGGEPKTMVPTHRDHQTVCYLTLVGLRTLRMRIDGERDLLLKLADMAEDTRNEVQHD